MVADATSEAQRLIAEATAEANRLVTEATAESTRLVDEATAESTRLVDEATAESNDWALGDEIEVLLPNGEQLDVTIGGVYSSHPAMGPLAVSLDDYAKAGGPSLDQYVYVALADGAAEVAVPLVEGRTESSAGATRWWLLLGGLAALGLS